VEQILIGCTKGGSWSFSLEALQGGEAKEDVDSGRKLNATWHNATVQKMR